MSSFLGTCMQAQVQLVVYRPAAGTCCTCWTRSLPALQRPALAVHLVHKWGGPAIRPPRRACLQGAKVPPVRLADKPWRAAGRRPGRLHLPWRLQQPALAVSAAAAVARGLGQHHGPLAWRADAAIAGLRQAGRLAQGRHRRHRPLGRLGLWHYRWLLSLAAETRPAASGCAAPQNTSCRSLALRPRPELRLH